MREIGNTCDDTTRVILMGLAASGSAEEQRNLASWARDRKELFIVGRAMVADCWQRTLASFDPLLRFRFDYDHYGFVIERWLDQMDYWHPLDFVRNRQGELAIINDDTMLLTLERLAKADLHRTGERPTDLLLRHRAVAEQVREANTKLRTEMTLAAVDSLSSKSIQQFIDVHRAIHRGERIVCHGDDEKIMDRMHAASRTVPSVPVDRAMNSGMHPLIYRRTRRDGSGRAIQ